MSKVKSSKQTRYCKDLPSSQQRLSFSFGPSPKRSKLSEPGDAGTQRPHVPPQQSCLQQHRDASGSSFTSCPVCGKQVALLCINLHLDMGCADELPLLRSKPAAPFIGHMRSRPSALLVRHAADPDSQPVQGPKNTQQEFDGGFFQAVLHVGGEASARHADGVENDIEIYEACGDDGDDGDGGTAAASANLSASHFGDRKDAVCALEFPGRLSPAPSAEALAYPNGAVPSVAMKATASEPMPSAVHISRSGKLLNLMSAPRPSADITATSGSLPSHQDFASPAMSVPEASGSISLAVILEPEPAANRSLSTAVVEPLDGPLLPEMPWRSGVSGVTYHGGDPCDRSIRGEGLSTNAPVQAVSPVHPTFLTRVALRDGVRICTQKGLAGPGQLVGVAATAVAPVTVTADAIVSDGYGTIWTQEYHVTDDGGDSNSEGRYGGTSVMQQLGATHVATTLPSGEDGVAVAVANEDGEQEWEKQLQHAPKIALVASSPLKFRAVPNPFLEGQYVVAEFITAAEEMELLALCDDPILKPAWSSWIGQTYSNATAQKTRGKRWGVLPDYHRRGVAPLEHPLPPLLQLLAKRMREHIGILRMFQPNEANAIDYRRSRGSWLRPHVDDRILSGDLIVNLSMAGAAVMTFVKDKDKNKGRDGVKEGSVYCSGTRRGPHMEQRVEPQLQQRAEHQRQQQSVGEEVQVGLAPRSLQILSRSARYNYTHAIAPSNLLDERRVSITFRRSELRPFEKAAV